MSPFPRKLRWFVAATCVATLCVAAAAAFLTGWPSPGALALLGALALFSAQRDVLLPNGISLSPGLMICMAAVVVFHDEPSWLGPLLVGAAAAVYFPSFTKSSWGWIPFNATLSGLAYFAAGATFRLFPASADLPTWQLVVAAVPCVVASLAVAWSLLLLSYIVEGARPWREVLGELLPTGRDSVPFAIVGFLLGRLYLGLGPAVLLLVIVPILIAREVFASYMRVREAHDETVQLLVHALEQKDPYTAGHTGRVAVYAGYIAEELDFMPARAERLRFAALMHDIGKLVVPNQLLNKPGQAHRGGVPPRTDPRAGVGADAESHRLPPPDRRPRAQRRDAVRSRRHRPPDRALHHHGCRRVRRDDLHPVVPQGASAGRRVPRAARQVGGAVPPRSGGRAHPRDRETRTKCTEPGTRRRCTSSTRRSRVSVQPGSET